MATEIAQALTFARSTWGNQAASVNRVAPVPIRDAEGMRCAISMA